MGNYSILSLSAVGDGELRKVLFLHWELISDVYLIYHRQRWLEKHGIVSILNIILGRIYYKKIINKYRSISQLYTHSIYSLISLDSFHLLILIFIILMWIAFLIWLLAFLCWRCREDRGWEIKSIKILSHTNVRIEGIHILDLIWQIIRIKYFNAILWESIIQMN